MIPAGGSGKLVAKVKTSANQSGSFSKGVTVQTDVAGAPELRLSFAYRVVTPIEALPRANLVLVGAEGHEVQAAVVLRRADGKPLKVSELHTTLAVPLELTARPPTAAELADPKLGTAKGDLVLEASLPAGPQVARQNGMVTMATNHPDRPDFELPVTVWVRPALTVSPGRPTVRLPADGSPASATRFRVISPASIPFTITVAAVGRPDLLEVTPDSDAPKPNHIVVVRLKDGVDAARVDEIVQTSVKLDTSEPAQPTLEVPVLVMRARSRGGAGVATTRTPGP